MDLNDRELGMSRKIKRRDFINGVSAAVRGRRTFSRNGPSARSLLPNARPIIIHLL